MRRCLLISLLYLLLLVPESRADVVVIVRRQAEAAGSYVRICDIARVEGPNDQATEVARTVLGPTPPKGRSAEITRWDIESRLFEMGVTAKVTFTGNDTVTVFGNGAGMGTERFQDVELQSLNPMPGQSGSNGLGSGGGLGDGSPTGAVGKTLASAGARKTEAGNDQAALNPAALNAMPDNARDRVGQAISHYLAGRYQRPDIEVESTLLSLSEAIPYSAHEVEVDDAVNGRVPGKALLRLRVRETPDSAPRNVMVSADTEVYAQAPVAAKPLYKGDVLEAKDVSVARVRMESGQTYLPPNAKAAAGRELKRNLKQGEPVLAADAIMGEAVKRGEFVESITTSAGWVIKGSGKALGSGMVGDVITVEDSATKNKYKGRITGRGTVSVILKSRYELN